MFCGIVEGTGKVVKKTPLKNGLRLGLQASFALTRVKKGDSIAVNGCCLTVVSHAGRVFEADLSHETLAVSNLGNLKKGDRANLERPLRLGDRIDGHLVQGHVDGTGRIVSLFDKGVSREIEIRFPKKLRRYLIPKGSVAVDGISMTVNRLAPSSLTLIVVPHTLQATNLKDRRVGDEVNLEVDMMAKYRGSFLYGAQKK